MFAAIREHFRHVAQEDSNNRQRIDDKVVAMGRITEFLSSVAVPEYGLSAIVTVASKPEWDRIVTDLKVAGFEGSAIKTTGWPTNRPVDQYQYYTAGDFRPFQGAADFSRIVAVEKFQNWTGGVDYDLYNGISIPIQSRISPMLMSGWDHPQHICNGRAQEVEFPVQIELDYKILQKYHPHLMNDFKAASFIASY